MKNTILWFCTLLFLLPACGTNNDSGAPASGQRLEYSDLLRFSETENGTLVSILSPSDSTLVTSSYLLVDRDKEIPGYSGDATVVKVPVEKLVVFSSVHASALEELGVGNVVKGVAEAQYFKLPFIKRGLENGSIADVGNTSSPSLEKMMQISPDGVLVSIYEGMTVPDLSSSGISYIKLADNLETTPLGRAEWIKFIGLLAGRREKADSIFSDVEEKYNSLAKLVAGKKNNPKILTDNIYQGIWYVPGGRSYQARIIKDAGGDYLWADNKDSGSLQLSFEEVYSKGEKADIWLYKGFGTSPDADAVIAADSRHGKIPAINNGLWICDTSVSSLYEDFPFHPERLLREYILIFHPEVMRSEKPRYFTKAAPKK